MENDWFKRMPWWAAFLMGWGAGDIIWNLVTIFPV